MFCEKCGKALNDGVNFCTNCGAPTSQDNEQEAILDETTQQEPVVESELPVTENEEVDVETEEAAESISEPEIPESEPEAVAEPVNTPSSISLPKLSKKFLRKSVIIPVIAIVLLVALVLSNFAYAKNAVMKLLLSPEKYFAHVVNSNLEGVTDTLANNWGIAKDNTLNGTGANLDIELKQGEGLAELLSDTDAEDATEYIGWIKNVAISMKANNKDNATDFNAEVKLNDVSLGKIMTILDMNDMMSYISIPDYNPEYIGTSIDDGYYDPNETTEVINQFMNALPEKAGTKKLLTKYLNTVVESVDNVKEETTTITANGVSQKVTSLSIDIDGKLIKNVSFNFLNSLKEDNEIRKIVDEISEITGADAEDFWDEIDYAIESLDYFDVDDFEAEVSIDILVNSAGEIVGFILDAEGGSFETYVAEKGNKFGALMEFNAGGSVCFEGGGKKSGNKKTGEFNLEVMGYDILNMSVKDLDTKKLKEGLLNGSITLRCSDGIDALARFGGGIDRDALDILSSLAVTIKSSQKSVEDCDCTLSVDYKEEPIVQLTLKAKSQNAKKVSIPSEYIDSYDYEEVEVWADNFDYDKLIEKLRKAGLPEEYIEELEENIEYMF